MGKMWTLSGLERQPIAARLPAHWLFPPLPSADRRPAERGHVKNRQKVPQFDMRAYLWCAGTTLILKKRSENLGSNFGVQPIPRVAPRVAPRIGFPHKLGRESHSENCSENTPEFRELLREWPFHSESVFFKIGVVPRFLNVCHQGPADGGFPDLGSSLPRLVLFCPPPQGRNFPEWILVTKLP